MSLTSCFLQDNNLSGQAIIVFLRITGYTVFYCEVISLSISGFKALIFQYIPLNFADPALFTKFAGFHESKKITEPLWYLKTWAWSPNCWNH